MAYNRKKEEPYEFPETPGESSPTDGHDPSIGPHTDKKQWSPGDFEWIKKIILWRRGKPPENSHEVYRDEQVVGEMMTTTIADDVARAMNDAEQHKQEKERRSDGRS